VPRSDNSANDAAVAAIASRTLAAPAGDSSEMYPRISSTQSRAEVVQTTSRWRDPLVPQLLDDLLVRNDPVRLYVPKPRVDLLQNVEVIEDVL
jgi:hypothetical protein